MSTADLFSGEYEPAGLQESSTSYFSTPDEGLDPSLFDGTHLRPAVRAWILSTVMGWLSDNYMHPDLWARVWIAGSGASYQWSAAREPGDLDLMLGIDYTGFRHANPDFVYSSDTEIASEMNEHLYQDLYPQVDGISFGGASFEVTVYVNHGVSNHPDGITFINPYAAYDVTGDEWTVTPNPHPTHHVHPSWNVTVEADRSRAQRIVDAYNASLTTIRGATNPAHRTNGERSLQLALDAASGLYEEIHEGRKAAFGPAGSGYGDFHNYRWQSGKATGAIQAMKALRDYQNHRRTATEMETYGMELPDHESLIRRAGLGYRRG